MLRVNAQVSDRFRRAGVAGALRGCPQAWRHHRRQGKLGERQRPLHTRHPTPPISRWAYLFFRFVEFTSEV